MAAKRPKPDEWTGGALKADLRDNLRANGWVAVCEIALDDRLACRADVVAMVRSGRHTRVDLFEIKVTRGDLLGDLRREKWRSYLPHGRLWFALPDRLADLREIPTEAGVMVRRSNGWVRLRAPKPAEVPEVSTTLLRRLVMATADQRAPDPRPRDPGEWRVAKKLRAKLGDQLADAICDGPRYVRWVEEARKEWDRLYDEVEELKAKRAELRREIARAA